MSLLQVHLAPCPGYSAAQCDAWAIARLTHGGSSKGYDGVIGIMQQDSISCPVTLLQVRRASRPAYSLAQCNKTLTTLDPGALGTFTI